MSHTTTQRHGLTAATCLPGPSGELRQSTRRLTNFTAVALEILGTRAQPVVYRRLSFLPPPLIIPKPLPNPISNLLSTTPTAAGLQAGGGGRTRGRRGARAGRRNSLPLAPNCGFGQGRDVGLHHGGASHCCGRQCSIIHRSIFTRRSGINQALDAVTGAWGLRHLPALHYGKKRVYRYKAMPGP